jgi:hypothetical protein
MISKTEAVPLANKALQDDDVAGFRQLLDQCPELRAGINEPISDFDSPLITRVRSKAMLDALLEAGRTSTPEATGGRVVCRSTTPAPALPPARSTRCDGHGPCGGAAGMIDRVKAGSRLIRR